MQIVFQVIFFLLAAVILVSALKVVTTSNIVHAALWLISAFFGIGGLYLLLQAEFMAIVQVLVYIGAISVLMLFAIMLTRHVTGEGQQRYTQRWWAALAGSVVLFAVVMVPTVYNHPWEVREPAPQEAEAAPALPGTFELGQAFMEEYLLPFEIAAVILLVAMIGAIVIAYEDRARRRRVLTLAEEVALRKRQQDKPVADESGGQGV